MHVANDKRTRLYAGFRDVVPQLLDNGCYEGFEDLVDRANVWLKEQKKDNIITNMQSVMVLKEDEGMYSDKSKSKVIHVGPLNGADIRFCSPQPNTSLYCETTDTGIVHRAVCLFTSQLKLVLIYRPRRNERLSRPDGWFHTDMVYSLKDGHPFKY